MFKQLAVSLLVFTTVSSQAHDHKTVDLDILGSKAKVTFQKIKLDEISSVYLPVYSYGEGSYTVENLKIKNSLGGESKITLNSIYVGHTHNSAYCSSEYQYRRESYGLVKNHYSSGGSLPDSISNYALDEESIKILDSNINANCFNINPATLGKYKITEYAEYSKPVVINDIWRLSVKVLAYAKDKEVSYTLNIIEGAFGKNFLPIKLKNGPLSLNETQQIQEKIQEKLNSLLPHITLVEN